MRSVKLGLIGMGLIGTPHTRTLQRVEECDLVAMADIDEKHTQTAATLGAKYYRDYEEMINGENLQGVIIATPNHLHIAHREAGMAFSHHRAGCEGHPGDDPYVKELRHFAKVIQGEEPPRISGEDARRTLEVTLASQGCGETRRPVRSV
jgi:predicted dehydrogenase